MNKFLHAWADMFWMMKWFYFTGVFLGSLICGILGVTGDWTIPSSIAVILIINTIATLEDMVTDSSDPD